MKTNFKLNGLKSIGLIISLLFINEIGFAQTFVTTDVPKAIAGSPLNPSCSGGLSLSHSVSFTVSGVGTLSSVNQLLNIEMRLKTQSSGFGRLSAAMFLKAPDGTCAQISNKMGKLDMVTGTNKILDYTFRAPNNACLSDRHPDYEASSSNYFERDQNSRSGVFSTVDDIESVFNGKNADGTWTLYFGRTNSIQNNLPDVHSASLIFGEALPISPPDINAGKTCAEAVLWEGGPMCVTTEGKHSTSNRPSTSGCGWLSTSENNLWIKFVPTKPSVCINISGINNIDHDGWGSTGVQSIVVEAKNPGNPCDNQWTIVNCPRNRIYASEVGATMSHNHCFDVVVGNTYYFVIDGNAGAVTDMYLSGIDGLPTVLPIKLLSAEANCNANSVDVNWVTASEQNNDYFTLEYSSDGETWRELDQIKGSGNKSTVTNYEYNFTPWDKLGYVRLSQTDYDGHTEMLKTLSVSCDDDFMKSVQVYPNPSNGKFNVVGIEKGAEVKVFDIAGALIWSEQTETNFTQIDLKNNQDGVYFVHVTSDSQAQVVKVVKN